MHICNLRHVCGLTPEIRAAMKTLPSNQLTIILNYHQERWHPLSMPAIKSSFFFRSIYRNGLGSTVLDNSEALKAGNYFLCVKEVADPTDLVDEPISPWKTVDWHTTYIHHVAIEETQRWHTRSVPYVNMDRDADNIGGSSWDGCLDRWFKAGFRTRILYGVHSGLFPEE